MARIGIMGGTFDPVHLGHIGVAEAAISEAGLEKVIFIPAFIQPFKQDIYVGDAKDRLEMLRLATMYNDLMDISTWELDKEDISYTYDTVKHFLEIDPENEIYFLMGSDSLMNVQTWYKGPELLSLCHFIVGLRPTNNREKVQACADEIKEKYGNEMILLKKLMLPISSTMIREKILNHEPISGLVSPMVEGYIYEHELYI